MPARTRHIRSLMHRSEAVAALLPEITRREALLESVRALLPDSVARHCTQASLDDGLLTLSCDSPAWVDRLRFLSPQFLPKLAEQGERVESCRVRAQPTPSVSAAARLRPASPPNAPDSARRSLRLTADAIGNTPLADSLRRLANTLR